MRFGAARQRVIALLDRSSVRHGLLLAAAIFAVAQAWLVVHGDTAAGYDAHVYWTAASLDDPYGPLLRGAFDGYKYPPVLAQLLAPLHGVPWPVFWAVWVFLLFAAFVHLAGRWALPILFLYPLILGEFWLGNVNLFLAVAVLAGFRWPAAWSLVILTKVTPGIGLLWFLLRRDWRSLGIALGSTAALAGVSFIAAPDLWRDFTDVARAQLTVAESGHFLEIPVVLPFRLAAAIAIVSVGALTDRRWTVPVAAALAMPFAWWGTLSVAVAAIPLVSPASAPRAARLAGHDAPRRG